MPALIIVTKSIATANATIPHRLSTSFDTLNSFCAVYCQKHKRATVFCLLSIFPHANAQHALRTAAVTSVNEAGLTAYTT